jgi:hypothetical protein
MRGSLLGLLAGPSLLAAQSISGVVVDRASDRPIPGVVVVLLDSGNVQVARALTNEGGEYRVVATGLGVYRLRTLRIGFQPVTSEPIALTAVAEVIRKLSVASVAVSLDTVRVASRNACAVRPDSAAATFSTWEQVRTALTAAQLTARDRRLNATIVRYHQLLEPNRERVVEQSSRLGTGLAASPWTSRSGAELRRAGYVVTDLAGATIYFAPDLAVLASDAFVEDHCLKLAEARAPDVIAIEFEPTRERRETPEIRGTILVDRKSAELRRLDYRYANVDREQGYARAGGAMEFARMANGAWLISRWNVRMPVLVARQAAVRGAGTSGATIERTVSGVRVEGGEVALVLRGADTIWARRPLAILGTVADSVSRRPVAGAQVSVRGLARSATTDDAGRFRVPDMFPGEYTLEVQSPAMAAAGVHHAASMTLLDSASAAAIRLPSAEQVTAAMCPNMAAGSRMLAGVVRHRSDSGAARNASIVAEWKDAATPAGPAATKWLEARSDVRGAFRLCGVPVHVAIAVTARGEGAQGAASQQVTVPPASRPLEALGALWIERGASTAAVLTGVVLSDFNAQPIPDVEVLVAGLAKNTFTNAAGAFRITGIPAGTHTIEARRIGYKAVSEELTFAAGQALDRRLVLGRVPTLDTVAVKVSASLRSFEEHRALGLGVFFTRVDIEKWQTQQLSITLTQVQGIGMARGRQGQVWIVGRRMRPTGREVFGEVPLGVYQPDVLERASGMPDACHAQVYLDNMLMNPGNPTTPFDISKISAERVEAIEWYSGNVTVPQKYQSRQAECGVLVIHTRRFDDKR